MKLQNILFPTASTAGEGGMYFFTSSKMTDSGQIRLKAGESLTTDTYFNGLSADKWKKYTVVRDVTLTLHLQGKVHYELFSKVDKAGRDEKLAERILTPDTGWETLPIPWEKVILEEDHPVLQQAQDYILSHWGTEYEAIFSNRYLLEVTAKGANKGTMVAHVAKLLGIAPQNVYCMGDNQNDIPMLAVSAIPFAPANCSQPVKDWGARLVGDTDEHAGAQVIDIWGGIYK